MMIYQLILDPPVAGFNLAQGLRVMGAGMGVIDTLGLEIFLESVNPPP